MNQENKYPIRHLHPEKLTYITSQSKMLGTYEAEQTSITPKRPLLSRDRLTDGLIDVSPLTDSNFRSEPIKSIIKNDVNRDIEYHMPTLAESHAFIISPPQPNRLASDDNDENSDVPVFLPRKARPAPATTWKAPAPIAKSSTLPKITLESNQLPAELPAPTIVSFQPAIRARVPFNLSSSNMIEKQTHAYTLWLNALFTPVEYLSNPSNSTVDHSTSNEDIHGKSLKLFAESNRWHTVCDRARELFAHEIQQIASKISVDMDIDQSRINPKSELNFNGRTVSRQALLNFISSYNRIWFRLAMEIIFPIKIENYHQLKFAIDQYLIQSTIHNASPSNDNLPKKNTTASQRSASIAIRLTIKNMLIIIIFLERAKMLRLIDTDPCLYARDSKFKSTKESLDILSRDFISSDTNLLRRLKLAGYEPVYRQTSLDEYNYLIGSSQENKLFDDLKDGIRLTRCAQILLSPSNEQVARLDLSTRLKCPVVNLVHKLLNIDQAFELFQTYSNISLTGISNKDIMNGSKQRTLELLWRIFIGCYLPKQLSPIDRLNEEISFLKKNLSKFCTRSIEQQLIAVDILPVQKQYVESNPIIHLIIKWVQLICAHYKFWLYDLQESFADGRALLFIISYYLPSLCDYNHDIKHLTTLATCQTQEEHLQFNNELTQNQQLSSQLYEKNVKSNFRCLEECVKQFGTFSSDLVKYEYYAKDVPDERCTIIILAMLAHDLLFLNHPVPHDFNFRSQSIFNELKGKYLEDGNDSTPIDHDNLTEQSHQEEIEIITENRSIDDGSIEKLIPVQLSISSSTVTCSSEHNFVLPVIQVEVDQAVVNSQKRLEPERSVSENPCEFVEIQSNENSNELSPSVLKTVNNSILDRIELASDSINGEDVEETFNTARSTCTTLFDHRRASISAAMATLSLDDFVELEKTIENEEMKVNGNKISSFFVDETILSEVDSVDTNKSEEASFTDPVHSKMLKETLILFLNHQQASPITGKIPESTTKILPLSLVEREIRAATMIQSYWRGYRIRSMNKKNNHPIVVLLEKYHSNKHETQSFCTLRDRMMQIVREFSEMLSSSVAGYLHLLRSIKPIVTYSFELRHLIAEQGLLRLFFILLRCCNRSEPSNILLCEVLNFLELFTVQHELTMKLIDKQEQLKDFNMLILKYYQNNGWELFEQICCLLQLIVNDDEARKKLRANKSFTDAVEYVYKRLFNKASIDDEKYRQQVRSTPKQPTGLIKHRITLFNRSSMLNPTPKMPRSSSISNDHTSKKNLASIEKFMKVFYQD